MTNSAYVELETRHRRVALLGETSAILHWDTAAIMPDGAASARAEQLAEMQAVIHGLKTASEVGDLIGEAEAQVGDLDDWQRANLNEMSRQWIKARAVPEDLVVALSRACSACETAWRSARPAADFSAVKPLLQEVLDLTREAGQAKAEALCLSLYDALLDDYEPGGRSADIDRVFGELQAFLPNFLQEALDVQASRPSAVRPEGPFPSTCKRRWARGS